jgi:hypothetical protein
MILFYSDICVDFLGTYMISLVLFFRKSGVTTTFLNLASNGSFLHTSATKAGELLLTFSQITPTYEAKPPQELVQKQIAEPESFPNPYQPLAIIPDTGETPVSANVFEFEDEYFSEFGNTSN